MSSPPLAPLCATTAACLPSGLATDLLRSVSRYKARTYYMHYVRLGNLTSRSTYSYKVKSGSGAAGAWNAPSSVPARGDHVLFARRAEMWCHA